MKKNLTLGLLILFLMISCKNEDGWQDLFNGKNLDGWVIKGGKAKFTVEDKAIVGETVLGNQSTFLCTAKNYGDFILELELNVDTSMNSGIQFRSQSYPEFKNGIVHGYQMEVDPSSRGWSGGIYDESRRGWLYTLDSNPEAKTAFRNGEWNKYRIEAIGNHIMTWVNGIQTADLLDNTDSTGFIALQVHFVFGEENPWTVGTKVKWRNIRILTDNLEANRQKPSKEITQINFIPNTISDFEKKNGWKLLFDGVSSTGWIGAYMNKFPEKGWEIKDGTMTVLKAEGKESENGGDIVTINQYKNFELSLDFLITDSANSGIKYYVTESEKNKGSAIGLEYQILDDQHHPDAKLGRDGNRTLASLYDLIPAKNKRDNAVGLWNNARIIAENYHVEHWLNGFKVLGYNRNSQEFRNLVAISKYKIWEKFGEAEKGHILLQDHGSKVSFRSIKIREL